MLTVNGTNFVSSSTVNWNGSPRATQFVSSTHLTATILASDVAAATCASVTVVNPGTTGGTSKAVAFLIALPIMDMGTSTYKSFQGGLYENETNTIPSDHLSDGIAFSSNVQRRDTNGNPSSTGKIVFVSVGESNPSAEFVNFAQAALRNSTVNNSAISFVNGAAGGSSACRWTVAFGAPPCNPNGTNEYDRVRDKVLAPLKLTEPQVQVAWIEVADRQPASSGNPPLCDPTMSGCTNTLSTEALHNEQELGQIFQAAKTRWPNLTFAFLSSRIYGGYSTGTVSPEPYAFEYGFSTKWAIQAQINQIRTGTIDPVAGNLSYSVAPWIAWAAYFWANGTNPRSDGLNWCDGQAGSPCNGEVDFLSDGEHPVGPGLTKTTNQLMNFFLSSPVTTPWFVKH